MSNPKKDTITIRLVGGECIQVAETDYADVAGEVYAYALDELARFQDRLREFLEQREAVAPTSVNRVRVLDSILSYEARKWFSVYRVPLH